MTSKIAIKKRLINFIGLCVLNISPTIFLHSQRTEQDFRRYFESRISNLAAYEGIFRVSLKIDQNLQTKTCNFSGYENDNFDLIAIYRKENDCLVFSIKNNRNLGYIIHDSKNRTIRFNSTGTINYPPQNALVLPRYINNYYFDRYNINNTNFQFFSFYFNYFEKYNFLEYNIARIINLECYSDDPVTSHFGTNVDVTAMAYKVYPSFDEKPNLNSTTLGTGVIVSPNGYVLTNYHVIKKEPELKWDEVRCTWSNVLGQRISDYLPASISYCKSNIFCTFGNQNVKLTPVYVHKSSDIALLKLDNINSTPNYAIIDTSQNSLGTEVYTLGFPLSEVYGNDVKYTNGYIASNQKKEMYGLNMGINPGNSGGGLFSKQNGQLLALTSSRLNEAAVGTSVESIAFAMRLNYFSRFVKNGERYYPDVFPDFASANFIDPKPKVFIKDRTYNPIVNTDRNISATVQIKAEN